MDCAYVSSSSGLDTPVILLTCPFSSGNDSIAVVPHEAAGQVNFMDPAFYVVSHDMARWLARPPLKIQAQPGARDEVCASEGHTNTANRSAAGKLGTEVGASDGCYVATRRVERERAVLQHRLGVRNQGTCMTRYLQNCSEGCGVRMQR